MEEETWSRRGWRVGVRSFKIAIAKRGGVGGVQISYVLILGGKVLIQQVSEPPPSPPGRNKRPAPFKFLYNILTIIFLTLHGTSREKQG